MHRPPHTFPFSHTLTPLSPCFPHLMYRRYTSSRCGTVGLSAPHVSQLGSIMAHLHRNSLCRAWRREGEAGGWSGGSVLGGQALVQELLVQSLERGAVRRGSSSSSLHRPLVVLTARCTNFRPATVGVRWGSCMHRGSAAARFRGTEPLTARSTVVMPATRAHMAVSHVASGAGISASLRSDPGCCRACPGAPTVTPSPLAVRIDRMRRRSGHSVQYSSTAVHRCLTRT